MPFYVFAWIASVTYGVEVIIGKLTSKHAVKNPWLFNFFWALFVLLFSIPFAVYNHVTVPVEWPSLLVASLFYMLAGIFYVLPLYTLDVSVWAPMFNLRTPLSVLFSAWILGEILTTQQYAYIGIIFVAGVFVTLDERLNIRSFFRWPIALAITQMVILALMGVYINKAITTNGYWVVTLWMGILSQIAYLFTLPFFAKEMKRVTKSQIGALMLMAVAGLFGTLAANRAYSENVSVSATIIGLPFSMIFAFLFSIFAPKLLEKHSLKVYAIRFTGAAIMFWAAMRLSG